jgi:NAD(P)H-flavin reductase
MKNIYMPDLASVVEIVEETPDTRTFTISLQDKKSIKAEPGQFVEFTIFGHGEFPVSIAGVLGEGGKYFQATVQTRGSVTGEIGKLTVGSTVGVRGPFGNGYPLDDMEGKNILMVTGGIGLSAVTYLINRLLVKRDRYGSLILLHGARTPEDLIYRDAGIFNTRKTNGGGLEIRVAVERPDDGWKGHVGVVTALLAKTAITPKDTRAVVCGPGVMMKNASADLSERGIPDNRIYLSMERRMQCGMGVCGHCMVGQKRVCVDGPVLPYGSIRDALERIF